jgi:hypothetical protein
VRFCLLGFVALLVAHDAVHFAHHEIERLLGGSVGMPPMQHPHWPLMSMCGTAAGLVLFGWTLVRFTRLRSLLRGRAFTWRARPGTAYRSELIRLWSVLYPAVVVAYAVLENVEHLAADGRLEWLSTLVGPQHALALPVLALVTLVLAAIGSLVRWRIAILQARLAAAGPGRIRPRVVGERPLALWSVIAATCAHVWILARGDAGRAPPIRVAAS